MHKSTLKVKDSRHCSSLVDLLCRRALQCPDEKVFTFVSDNGESMENLTYGELDRRSRRIAARIQADYAPGERALLLYPPGLDFIPAFFGCLYSGVAAVPAYPPRDNHNAERLRALAGDVQARLILSTASQKQAIERRLTEFDQSGSIDFIASDLLTEGETAWRDTRPDADSPAFIQYTSGSSGSPKGVVVSHANILHNEKLLQAAVGTGRNSVGVGWLPAFHDMGLIGNILHSLYAGFPMTLFSPVAFIQKPLMWLQLITSCGATLSGGPNFAYDHCVNRISDEQKRGLDLSTWEIAFNGAEPVRAGTLERFAAAFASCGFRREAFYPCYGMAESTLFITGVRKLSLCKTSRLANGTNKIDGPEDACDRTAHAHDKVSCGFPRFDQKVLIVDPETLLRCPDGKVGEIWTSGPSVAQGYWNKPEETEKIFGARLADSGEGPFLRTGDLGLISEGELYVTGRRKDLIIIRGRNHYPQDIEQTAENSHPALRVGGAAAFSVEVEGEERLVVLQEVERSALRKINADEVCECVRREVLSQHELNPHAVVLLKTRAIPKTSSGKVQRRRCRELYLAGELEPVGQWRFCDDQAALTYEEQTDTREDLHYEDRRASIESWLAANISGKTGAASSRIDVRKPLAAYGLDSMSVVSLSGELEEWLGRKISPTIVYDYPTIESLARYLAIGTGSAEPVVCEYSPAWEPADEPIAIVGMGCRFPGASNPDAFWQLLKEGRCGIAGVPSSRWDSSLYPAATRFGGFLDAVDLFDPLFFGISAREAETMDPQQRLLLEVTWEALENAFLPPGSLSGTRTGVFIGISSHDYSDRQRGSLEYHVGTGNAQSIAANRLSYSLDLRGPSWAVDTACSSSLVAVHQACQSLRQRESDTAIAGGVNVILSPELSSIFSQAGMLAADGRCKTFDASADGYVRGEGCGVIILKRLSDALAEGNTVLALIRGSAVNQDGRSNGLTAPNGLSQQEVIRAALRNAGVDPAQVGYVEAHGTGTSLGDPIEFNSTAAVLSSRDSTALPCMIGSVKTNIGHLEAAAGIAGIIKTVLALGHGTIPPHLHLNKLNPHLAAAAAFLAVPTRPEPWPRGVHPRIAGVSSFGFGGTNAHIVIQEPPPVADIEAEPAGAANLLALSARDESALKDLARRYELLLREEEDSLPGITARAAVGRQHFEQRLAVTGNTAEMLRRGIAAFLEGKSNAGFAAGRIPPKGPKTVFLFTGQGSQYAGMGRMLYDGEPVFRAAMERCAAAADPFLKIPLLDVVYPKTDQIPAIDETAWTQPALFALEYSLAELWRSWGVRPDAVLGHSLGEYVAACVAGVFSPEDGMRLVAERARLMQEIRADGAMIAIAADEEAVTAKIGLLSQSLSIAAVNGSGQCVISGDRAAAEVVAAQFAAEGYGTARLKVSQAFHSPLMDSVLEPFRKAAENVCYSEPKIALLSNVTGVMSREVASADYWVRHIRQPVRYHDAIVELRRLGFEVYLEIGPRPLLLSLVGPAVPPECALLPSLQKGTQDRERMLRTAGELYTLGVPIDWRGFHGNNVSRHCSSLPNYPFQRKRYWMTEVRENPRSPERAAGPDDSLHPLLGRRQHSPLSFRQAIFEADFGKALPAFLSDCNVQGSAVFPAAAFIEMLLAAAGCYFKTERLQLYDVEFIFPLVAPCENERIVHTVLVLEDPGKALIRIYSSGRTVNGREPEWTLHVSGIASQLWSEPRTEKAVSGSLSVSGTLRAEDFYADCSARGMEYGPMFRAIREIRLSGTGCEADLVLVDSLRTETGDYRIHPVLLDAALQAVLPDMPQKEDRGAWTPARLSRLKFHHAPAGTGAGRVFVSPSTGSGRDSLNYDLNLRDGEGRHILQVEGLSLRRTTPEPARSHVPTDLLYEITWQPSPVDDVPVLVRVPRNWLIFSDRGGAAERLASRLKDRGDHACLVFAGDRYQEAAGGYTVDPDEPADFRQLIRESRKDRAIDGVVHLWSLDCRDEGNIPITDTTPALALACRSTLNIVQSLAESGHPGVNFTFVTRGAMAVDPADPVQPFQSPLWGLARVMAAERPESACRCIDLETADEQELDALFREVAAPGRENQIAWRGGIRHVARLAPVPSAPSPHVVSIRHDACYLVTGGAGGMGTCVAAWLVEHGAGTIIVTGRTAASKPLDPRLMELAAGRTEIVAVSVDVADYVGMASLMERIRTSMPPLRGVIHAAGVLDDCLLEKMSWDAFDRVLTPKVRGTWNLHLLTRGTDLDFFTCFSSVASLLGSPAQGNYAAANAFVDGLCHYRRKLGLPAVALNWGPWKDTGMTAASVTAPLWKRMEDNGIDAIDPEEGIGMLGLLLASPAAQLAVARVRWSRFFRHVPMDKTPFFRLMAAPGDGSGDEELSPFSRGINGKTGEELYLFVLSHFHGEIAAILGLEQDELLQDRPLNTLGIDSLMAFELIGKVRKETGLKLSFNEIIEGMTLQDMAKAVCSQLERGSIPCAGRADDPDGTAGAASGSGPVAAGDDPAALLANLHRLSDEEVRELLMEMQSGDIPEDLIMGGL